jgi:DNA repair exonuclease SbcCD nuclease subunit
LKIAVITDTHFGVRNNSQQFLKHQVNFLQNVFFPTLQERGIEQVFHLGDLVESRTKIDINVAKVMREEFLDPLNENYITNMIPGNHDSYFKNTLEVNAMNEFAGSYENIHVHNVPDSVHGILLVPWICEDNYDICIKAIQQTKSTVCFGHFEINGCQMEKGRLCDHGLSQSIFNKFDVVASGHFHGRSKLGNIEYIGNPHQTTWSDWGDERGFNIFDTVTREFEFIKNPVSMFEKITYNDSEEVNMKPDMLGKYVKIIVKIKNDPYKFEQFVNAVENSGAIETQVIEDVLDLGVENAEELIDNAEDVNSLLDSYVDALDLENRNEQVKKFIHELYMEAQLVEV